VFAVAVPAFGHFAIAPLEISAAMDGVGVGERGEARPCLAVILMTGGRAVDIREAAEMRKVSFPLSGLDEVAVRAAELSMDRT
jgi:hypothetical protein